MSLLVEVEGQSFEKRVSTLVPLLIDCLSLYDPSLSEEEIVHSVARNARVVAESLQVVNDGDSDKDKDMVEKDTVSHGNGDCASSGDSEEGAQDMNLGDTDSNGKLAKEGETEVTESTEPEVTLAVFDYLLFTVLCTVRKLLEECAIIRAVEFSELISELWCKWLGRRGEAC